jgi:hypothetical protein
MGETGRCGMCIELASTSTMEHEIGLVTYLEIRVGD